MVLLLDPCVLLEVAPHKFTQMRSTLERSLNICFPTIKLPPTTTTTTQSPSLPPEDLGRPLPNPATATSSSSINLVKNFNSLYDLTFDSNSHSSSLSCSTIDASNAATPDLAAAFASQRFFFSSPGRSNSIVESSGPSSSFSSSSSLLTTSDLSDKIAGAVAVPKYSQDPFMDFRRSMQEMVESRRLVDVRADWEHLNELLTCYLSLNPKSAHKFIIRAFSDLIVSMMAAQTMENGGRGYAGKRRSMS